MSLLERWRSEPATGPELSFFYGLAGVLLGAAVLALGMWLS